MRTPGTTTGTSDDGFRRLEVIPGVGRGRRGTDEEKAWIVAESLDPRTSASAVARRHGLQGEPTRAGWTSAPAGASTCGREPRRAGCRRRLRPAPPPRQ